MIRDYATISFRHLKRTKVRSWITILGIVISIASIVALIAISDGLTNAIEDQFAKIGANKIFISAKGDHHGLRAGLTTRDVEVLERMGDFKFTTPYLWEPSLEVEYQKEKQYLSVIGWPTEDADERFEAYDLQFIEGGPFRGGEKLSAIIAIRISEDTFKRDVHERNKLLIGGRKFEVKGVLEEIGNDQDDRQMYVPIDTLREITGKEKEISFIDLTVKPGLDINTVADRIKRTLERTRKDENFEIFTPEQILKQLNSILGIVQAILAAIAAISLLVGAIGIMNIMFTAVLERTKEIGIMKSLGARNKDIMLLFLLESGLIGLVGGIIGLFFGYLAAFGVEGMSHAAGFTLMTIKLDPSLILIALGFAVGIGMLSGALPARRAALLHPVDALRWNQ